MGAKPGKPLPRKHFKKGEIIIQQGDYGTCGYVIQTGKVEVFITQDGKETHLATLGAGETVGEMALLFNQARSASVRALTPCDLIVMDRQGITADLASAAPSIRALMKVFSQRLRQHNGKTGAASQTPPG